MNPTPHQANIKNALISTSDKSHLLELAEALSACQINLLATGSTAKFLSTHGFKVTEISDYTGLPEMMGGRVKTLHHKIHAGILARRGTDDELLAEQKILAIDLLVVNLYPFAQSLNDPNATFEQHIENIDIGGPALLRAAAKNFQAVTAIIDPNDYPWVIAEIQQYGHTSLSSRRHLAQKVFASIADYDRLIANYLADSSEEPCSFPEVYSLPLQKLSELRYGENPHQLAALYGDKSQRGLAYATQVQGKALSFNNYLDSDAALNCVLDLPTDLPACVIVKHGNPCGAAQASDPLSAYQLAYATDPSSAFGGIIAFNTPLTYLTVESILAQQFVEVILAPCIDEDLKPLLSSKPSLRVLCYSRPDPAGSLRHYSISGGLLLQETDHLPITQQELTVVTRKSPTPIELNDLRFAWQVAKWTKSNAIVYAKNGSTLGIGAGQCSRVFSAEIAVLKAHQQGFDLKSAVMASDAFFPFADGLAVAIQAGVSAVIQPGGSKNDSEVIAAADQAGIAMVFTGSRHFRH